MNRLLAPLALAVIAVGLVRCSSPEGRGTLGDILRTGGEIGAAVTGDERFGRLGETTARSLTSYRDFLPVEEHSIGRSVAATILSRDDYPVLEDDAVQEYVNKVGLAVALAAPEARQTYAGYRFVVVDSPELNAFAAPGGFVFVTTGMLARTRNEDELAGVLAHEIAHVTLQHGLQAIPQANVVEAGSILTEIAIEESADSKKERKRIEKRMRKLSQALGKSVDEIVFTLLSGGYGADKEFAADQLGARLLASAGYDPGAIRDLLDALPENPGAGGWLSTHPAADARVARLGNAGRGVGRDALAARAERHAAMLARL